MTNDETATPSFSRIHTFSACPRMYYFKYVERLEQIVPMTEDRPFGKAFHAAYYAALKTGSVDEAVKAFEETFDFPYEQSPAPLTYKNISNVRKALEMMLASPVGKVIDTERRVYAGVGDTVIQGVIDALVERDGERMCVEIKTRGRDYAYSEVESLLLSPQYHIYSLLEGGIPVIIDAFIFKKEVERRVFPAVPNKPNPAVMDDIAAWIAEIKDAETSGRFPRNVNQCTRYGRCDFLDICGTYTRGSGVPIGYRIRQQQTETQQEEI